MKILGVIPARGGSKGVPEKNRLYDYEISDSELQSFRDEQERWAQAAAAKKKGKSSPKQKKKAPKKKKKSASPKKNLDCPEENTSMKTMSVSYFFLGDMLEALFRVILDNFAKTEKRIKELRDKKAKKALNKVLDKAREEFKTFRLVLTDLPLTVGRYRTVVNMADLPVSLTLWTQFVFNQVTQKGLTKFTLIDFINSLTNWLIPNMLRGHTFKDAKILDTSQSVKALSLTGGNIKTKKVNIQVKHLPDFLLRVPAKNLKDETDYLVLYSSVDKTSESGKEGDLFKDGANGIYHFYLAKDRGMVKNISFSRFDVPGKKESLMVNSVSLYDELRMPYTASIEMFGNNLFFPGSIIYINTSNMGFGDPRNKRSAAARLGIGGYYQVLSVSTSFSPSGINTSLQTSYLSWADDAMSLFSEMRDEGHVTDGTKPNETEVTSPDKAESSSSRPEFVKSDPPRSDLGFIFADENLTKEEKVAIRNLVVHGEDSHTYRRSVVDLPSGTGIEVLENNRRTKNFTIKVTRGEEKYTVKRKDQNSSVEKKID